MKKNVYKKERTQIKKILKQFIIKLRLEGKSFRTIKAVGERYF